MRAKKEWRLPMNLSRPLTCVLSPAAGERKVRTEDIGNTFESEKRPAEIDFFDRRGFPFWEKSKCVFCVSPILYAFGGGRDSEQLPSPLSSPPRGEERSPEVEEWKSVTYVLGSDRNVSPTLSRERTISSPLGGEGRVRGVVQNRCGPQRLSEVAVQKRGHTFLTRRPFTGLLLCAPATLVTLHVKGKALGSAR
jgi:hypothetical protein